MIAPSKHSINQSQDFGLKKLKDEWAQNIFGGIIWRDPSAHPDGGCLLATLVGLPREEYFETWYQWSSGDVPAVFRNGANKKT